MSHSAPMDHDLFEFLTSFLTPDRLAGFDRVLEHRTRFLTVVLEDVYQSHNASACLRSCDCFGVQDVHIIETHNTFEASPDVELGAARWLTLQRYDKTQDCIEQLKQNGYRILATSPNPNAESISHCQLDRKTALMFGTEKDGLSEAALEAADGTVRIDMYGFTESLNISVAVAISLHDLIGRLHRNRTDWPLGPAEVESLRSRWVRVALRHKLEPLLRRWETMTRQESSHKK